MSKKTVSIFTTKQGHQSIAQSVESTLNKAAFTTYTNLHAGQEFHLYEPFYQLAPKLFKYPYNLTKNSQMISLTNRYIKSKYEKTIARQLAVQKPDVVISVWFALNNLIKEIVPDTPLINIIQNPRSNHPIEVLASSQNLVFDKQAKKVCQNLGVSADNIHIVGWFVRDQFEKTYNQSNVRKNLGLKPHLPCILIIGGSEGTLDIIKTLPGLIRTNTPATIIIACGTSRSTYTVARTFGGLIQEKNKNLKIIPLRFTNHIHKYIQAADLVIGKAGPNLLFETVATHTPFLATTHIAGQETGNLDIINQYKLGLVEENSIKGAKLINSIINNIGVLKKFHDPLKKMANKNKKAKPLLSSLTKKLSISN